MGADEIEEIGRRFWRLAGRNVDDGLEKLIAMTLRFFCKFLVDRIPVFGTLPLHQLESVMPQAVALRTQPGDHAPRNSVFAETGAPLANQRGSRNGHRL